MVACEGENGGSSKSSPSMTNNKESALPVGDVVSCFVV